MMTCDSPGLMPVQEAITRMLASFSAITEIENIELSQAHGRVLASDVYSSINVPPAANSAMDGYAVKSQDLQSTQSLTLIGTSLAGQPFTGQYQAGSCIRIMTGAILPAGYDAVEMQENTQVDSHTVRFPHALDSGKNVRQAGEDIAQGDLVFAKGTRLKGAELALLASIGIAELQVYQPLTVAVIATGDELTPPGQPLTPGAIYESNRYALISMLKDWHCNVLDLGIVADHKSSLQSAFEQAAANADLILSSGGVSVGEADYVKEILEQIGQINFWKVAIKPGKPFAFGKIGSAIFCGLPGNPVSSHVTCQQLVRPVLKKLAGEKDCPLPHFFATTECTFYKRPGRADYQRGIYYRDNHGKLWVKPNGKQGSGIMSSIAKANCYVLIEQDSGNIEAGEQVKIQPFALFT